MVERAIEGQRNILKNVFRGYDTIWSDEKTVGELMSYWQRIYAASDNMRSDVRALRLFKKRLREYCGNLFADRAEAEL